MAYPRSLHARLNPALLPAVKDGPLPVWELAALSGVRHQARLSMLLHSETVPISARPELERVARLVNFPVDQIFLADEEDRVGAAR